MVMVDILKTAILTTSPVIRFWQHVLCERTLKNIWKVLISENTVGAFNPAWKNGLKLLVSHLRHKNTVVQLIAKNLPVYIQMLTFSMISYIRLWCLTWYHHIWIDKSYIRSIKFWCVTFRRHSINTYMYIYIYTRFFNCYFFMFTINAVVHDAQNKRNTPHNYGKQNITSWLFTCLAKIVTIYMYFTSFEVNTWDRQSVLFHFSSFWSYYSFCSTACPCPIPVCLSRCSQERLT